MQRLLDIENLRTTFDIHVGKVQAVRGIDLHVDEGETVGIVGESGCGKSVSMLSILHLLPDYAKISADKMVFEDTDLTQLTPKMFRKISGDQIGMIFQDPMTSLNPVYTVGNQLMETLRRHTNMSRAEARARSIEMLKLVGINNPEQRMKQYPHEFSGGMRQRAMIAMTLLCNPKLLIADEPTTALDVTIQAQILELMKELKERIHSAIILITHDLGIISDICDSVIVMYAGRIVEKGSIDDIFYRTAHPYTQGLLKCLPRLDSDGSKPLEPIEGTPVDLLALPAGCPFAPRCEKCRKVCLHYQPPYYEINPGHTSACWLHAPEFGEVRA